MVEAKQSEKLWYESLDIAACAASTVVGPSCPIMRHNISNWQALPIIHVEAAIE